MSSCHAMATPERDRTAQVCAEEPERGRERELWTCEQRHKYQQNVREEVCEEVFMCVCIKR